MKVFSSLIILAVITLFTILSNNSTIKADQPMQYLRTGMYLKQPADNIFSKDLNNDGKKELIMQEGRRLAIYFIKNRKELMANNKSFISSASQLILSEKDFLYQFYDVNNDGKDELITIAPDGIYLRKMKSNSREYEKRSVLFESNSMFHGKAATPLKYDFIFKGDKGELLFLPATNSFKLMKLIKGKLVENGVIKSEPGSLVYKSGDGLRLRYNCEIILPHVNYLDINSDDIDDFIAVYSNTMKVWTGKKDGMFDDSMSIEVNSSIKKKKHKKRYFYYELETIANDLNADGDIDILSSHSSSGLTGVFFGGKLTKEEYEKPDTIIRTNGWTIGHWLEDIDNDNKKELIILRMDKLGIMSGLNTLISSNIAADILIYKIKGDVYADEPGFQLPVLLPISIGVNKTDISITSSYTFSIKGDFNGDNRKDILLKTAGDNIEIFYYTNSGYSSDPSVLLSLKYSKDANSTETVIFDINGDNKDDILFLYENINKKIVSVEILISK